MSARSTRSAPHQVEKNSLGSVAAAAPVDSPFPSSEVRDAPRLRSRSSLLLNPQAPPFVPGPSRSGAIRASAVEPQAPVAPASSAPAVAPGPASVPPSPRPRSRSAGRRISIADPVPPVAPGRVADGVAPVPAAPAPMLAVPAPVSAVPAPPLAPVVVPKKSKGPKRPNPPEDDAPLVLPSQDPAEIVSQVTRRVKRKKIRPPVDSDATPPLSPGKIERHADKP